ncbi:MAG: preprotein translocase subunit SecY [Candidatus Micrarchaeota archaeon]|nr:preprotein translocase subunit SecY [Candidatus Micrarchaeota archaeon]
MDLRFLDVLLKYVPSIAKPAAPLSFREKLKWTAIIMGIYFLMFSTPAFGVSTATINQPLIQLISVIFASRIGSLITVGIGPIVLASIVLQLIIGAGLLHIDLNDQEQKGRFQSIQKLAAMLIAIIESFIFVSTGYVPLVSSSYFGVVVLQLALSAIFIVFLDESMTKWGITSGINLFIAGGVAYAIVAGTTTILLGEAIQAIETGGATAIPNAILAFGPLFFAILVFLISIYAYDMKIEIPLVFSQMRGIGGRLPIPFLYVSVLPVILATSFELSMTVWFRFFAGVTGTFANLAKFIALYQVVPGSTGTSQLSLVGGIVYLISPNFPLPYSTTYGGIGGYSSYFAYLATGTSQLYLPWGGIVAVPEFVHIIIYALVLVALAVVFGKFWIEMTGQSPKNVAEQLQDVGWQVPGFRRDPRIVESILNKYIPTITVLGSVFVALLAALATLTGAVGTGMGILLTVGIMYMVYQQLEQEHALEQYPQLNKMLS